MPAAALSRPALSAALPLTASRLFAAVAYFIFRG